LSKSFSLHSKSLFDSLYFSLFSVLFLCSLSSNVVSNSIVYVSSNKSIHLSVSSFSFSKSFPKSKQPVNIIPFCLLFANSLVISYLIILFIFKNARSEEHTSELQSRFDLVCRLLLEKTKNHD